MPKSVTFNEWGAILDIHSLSIDDLTENAMDRTIVPPLLAGRIDAGIAWFINDGVQARVQGQDTDWLKFSDIGLSIPSSTIIANLETIENDPETVAAFVRAVIRGWEFTRDNPDEAFSIFMEKQPQVDEVFNETKLPLVLELIESDQGLATFDAEAWENLKTLYMDSDLLKVDLDLSEVYTTEFLP
jgi:NitT/TauT family transport system substrate-binding protein